MKKLLVFALFVVVLLLPFISFGQPFPASPNCDGPFTGPCPIDGGIGFLIAAGLAYGGKKSFDIGKKK